MDIYPRAIQGPFSTGPLGIKPATSTSQVGEIPKSFPTSPYCKLWLCFFGWDLQSTSVQTQEILHQPPRIILQS